MTFHLHEVEWTPELVARFWDAMSRAPMATGNYFSDQVGAALISFVRRHVVLGRDVLDFGAGQGHLARQLLDVPELRVSTCEYSKASAQKIADQFQEVSRFRGCSLVVDGHTSYKDKTFDAVFLVETLEHLPPCVRDRTLEEIWRILRCGGVIIITTPNNENLVDNLALCPECGALFHRMQHVASFDREKLAKLLEGIGYRTIYCDAVQLGHFSPGLGWRGIYRRWRYRKHRRPHLIYIGKKV